MGDHRQVVQQGVSGVLAGSFAPVVMAAVNNVLLANWNFPSHLRVVFEQRRWTGVLRCKTEASEVRSCRSPLLATIRVLLQSNAGAQPAANFRRRSQADSGHDVSCAYNH